MCACWPSAVFDVTEPSSLESLQRKWRPDPSHSSTERQPCTFMVANKVDEVGGKPGRLGGEEGTGGAVE